MKLAVAGKGGVGKTTLVALLAHQLSRRGYRVLAVDADPVNHLAYSLGVPKATRQSIVPISAMKELIAERAGGSGGGLFTLNPAVADLVERCGVAVTPNIALLQLGTVQTAGSGCFCPENALLKALLRHIVRQEGEAVLIDLEAGLEHLGRSTIERVDWLFIVVEPGMRSVETALRIRDLASQIGVRRVGAIANKIPGELELAAIKHALGEGGIPLLAAIPYEPSLAAGDLAAIGTHESLPANSAIAGQLEALLQAIESGQEKANGN
ncbi:MAG: AAA family ATPase [Cyanobacteria bacterium NC_groundwater_1444_Ag_S-0.65um_54_12]|nr:AAA family ATPase [Cyanobacteria bacterium NC_groundwater_1444_Ag_S-0.65um_54_12]